MNEKEGASSRNTFKVENYSVLGRIKNVILFGKHGQFIIWTKEQRDHLACYHHTVQKPPLSLLVWECIRAPDDFTQKNCIGDHLLLKKTFDL